MESQLLDPTLAGLDSTLTGLDPALSDSDSESDDVLKPGKMRITVRDNGSGKSIIIIESGCFDGVCRIPVDETTPDGKYRCALTSENEVFAGEFDTRGELAAAVIAFAKTAASGSKTFTASIKRLLM